MGIPSYFSQVIRKYSKILRNTKFFVDNRITFTHLYMDCNSIIYDAYHAISSTYVPDDRESFEQTIIVDVANRISDYINMIRPTDIVYIGFDGVVPLAKMRQQRMRRHKTKFLSSINFTDSPPTPKWDTCNITPGTPFMEKLSSYMYSYFNNTEQMYKVKKIVVSCSDESGEGEQKMFNHVRKNEMKNANVTVYGLDADLIMLSILHLKYCNNIYIFREAPEFLKSSINVAADIKDNEPYFLDISHLSDFIVIEMDCKYHQPNRVEDYILMCFFLGNDFLPHIPALNIRTNGLTVLMDVYRKHIGNYNNRTLISLETHDINWKYLTIFIEELANLEEGLMKQEYYRREKTEKQYYTKKITSDKELSVMRLPLLLRMCEKYVCVLEEGWRVRYSRSSGSSVGSYVEVMCWLWRYYSSEVSSHCVVYEGSMSPLLCDVKECVKEWCVKKSGVCEGCVSLEECKLCKMEVEVQLKYVLPESSYKDCGVLHKLEGLSRWSSCESSCESCMCIGSCSGLLCNYEWAFNEYFWECVPRLKKISIETLEKWNERIKVNKIE